MDASKIAAEHGLGSLTAPIVNTAICGAFAKSSGLVGIDAVCRAIEKEVPVKPEKNMDAAGKAFESTLSRQGS